MSAALVPFVCALVVAGLCALGPRLIARLPEPEPEREPATTPDSDSTDTTPTSPMDGVDRPPKVLYADLAARPHLGLKLAAWGAVAGLVVGLCLRDEAIIFAWLYLAVVGVLLGYVDAQTRLLPTRLIAPSYAVVIGLVAVAAAVDGETHDLVRAGLGWAAYGGFYFLMWFVYPRGLGYGDVRLSGLLGIALGYLGWGEVLVGMYAGFLLGGIVGGVLALAKVVDRRRYPFGPFMLSGALVGLAFGAAFADWYTAV